TTDPSPTPPDPPSPCVNPSPRHAGRAPNEHALFVQSPGPSARSRYGNSQPAGGRGGAAVGVDRSLRVEAGARARRRTGPTGARSGATGPEGTVPSRARDTGAGGVGAGPGGSDGDRRTWKHGGRRRRRRRILFDGS